MLKHKAPLKLKVANTRISDKLIGYQYNQIKKYRRIEKRN